MLPRSLLCSVCHSADCRRYFLGGKPPLPLPSPHLLYHSILRSSKSYSTSLDLTFLRLSTTIDYSGLLVSAEITNVQYHAVVSGSIYYHSDIFCNSGLSSILAAAYFVPRCRFSERNDIIIERRLQFPSCNFQYTSK